MNNELQQTPDNKWNDGDNRRVYDGIPLALPVPSTAQLGIWLAEQIPPTHQSMVVDNTPLFWVLLTL